MAKIGVIVSTTREARFGRKVADWVRDQVSARGDLEVEVLDLRDFDLPFFDESASSAFQPSTNANARRWQAKVAEFDGYVFVTAEYNHGIPAVLKNALDYSYREWDRKPAAFVGYGGLGAARAVEQLRLVTNHFGLASVKTGVHIAAGDFFGASKGTTELAKLDHLGKALGGMLDELRWWTDALRTAKRVAKTARPGERTLEA